MEVKELSFMGMLSYFHRVIAGMVDPRSASNATRYSLKDAVLGAFASFFRQNESFLEYQRQLNSRCRRDNAQSLFGLLNIPTVEQMKNILDGIAAKHFFSLFKCIYQGLKDQGYLRLFAALEGNLLVTLDGTQYYDSEKISCPCGSIRTSKQGKITYHHQAILPVIVSLDQELVISLPPEFITPQDGSEKQDCQQNAAKRSIASHSSWFEGWRHLLDLMLDDAIPITCINSS
ncbi:hypothetical protein [Microcystis aeruginosa]|uniref:H repeat-associated protein N-terminal domain-containing protein n=1 Tax=Microcystis aeruginosa NIES-2521 TaxID=2303983 RepID=A0A5A5S0J7_MICAE|nr:hypothetical protein [Microcystis aeruginosa]GCA80705.1 hypothetical protein MiTs_02714 [Microcystis aeruginosa NIES-2521]